MCDLQNSENLKRLVHVYKGNSALLINADEIV
jgi:hypothetical protein